MPRWFLPLFLVALAGLGLSIFGLVRLSTKPGAIEQTASVPDEVAAGLRIPAFTMTDQEGRTHTQALLDGRLTIVNFIFTHCPFACPMMTMAMNDLAGTLKDTPVRFLSISVDPTHDTPQRLAQYALDNAADTSRWTFLTGPQSQVDALLKDALGFALQPDTANVITLPGGGTMANIVHPTKLLLVGPDRRVLGFYESAIPMDIESLGRRARAAAVEFKLSTPTR